MKALVIYPQQCPSSTLEALIEELQNLVHGDHQIESINEKEVLTIEKIEKQELIFCFGGINSSILTTMENFARAVKKKKQKLIKVSYDVNEVSDIVMPITEEQLRKVIGV